MDEEHIRVVSRGIFKNKHKLEIIAAIADTLDDGNQDFYSRQVSKKLSEAADNQVLEVIRSLAQCGLVLPVDDKSDQLRHRYRARESSIWVACQRLRDELRDARWEPD